MFAFAVFALPRSGSTWLSNWLTTDQSICWHDPAEWALPEEVEAWGNATDKQAGICCTGMWLLAPWRPSVPTLKLTRPRGLVNASMAAKGLPELPDEAFDLFDALPYPSVSLVDLLNPVRAHDVQHFLLPDVPFDLGRHQELSRMNIQPSERELERIRGYVKSYNSANEMRNQ